MARGKKGRTQEQKKAIQEHFAHRPDPASAVLALHPAGAAVAVAAGPQLRVYDASTKALKTLLPAEGQAADAYVRALAFDATGRYLASGGDDKASGLRIWDCSTWECVQSIATPKKVTAVAFTRDGQHLLAGDKFGDLLVVSTQPPAAGAPAQRPQLLLGHYCAVLTSVALSAGDRYVVTTDRDAKVRVSVLPPPAQRLEGAPQIQAFCFGHADFATCAAFLQRGSADAQEELLVSGGGDGTVRLWDHTSGTLLCTLPIAHAQAAAAEGEKQPQDGAEGAMGAGMAAMDAAAAAAADGQQFANEGGAGQEAAAAAEEEEEEEEEEQEGGAAGSGEGDEEGEERQQAGAAAEPQALRMGAGGTPAVMALAPSPDGCWMVAAVDGRDDLCLLAVTGSGLEARGWFPLQGLHMPSHLLFDAAGRLWAAGGPPSDASRCAFIACATIGGGGQLEQSALPEGLGSEARQLLEARDGAEAEQLVAAAEQRRVFVTHLKKRQYTQAGRPRKRYQRDVQQQEAAAA